MRGGAFLAIASLCAAPAAVMAQSPPQTVFIEEMTWIEIRDAIQAGKTSIIIATAGTEQKGPHMVMGEHKYVLEYTTDKIARTLGNALVSAIITYVPEGEWGPNPTGHMRMPGTVSLPEDAFQALLVNVAKSHEAGGFKDIIFLGDSGGNQDGMEAVTAQLNQEWAGSARAHFIGDYYEKSSDDATRYITQELGIAEEKIGGHAGITDTSQMLYVNPNHIRMDKMAVGVEGSGVTVGADPRLATPEIGERLIRFKIDNAVAQIKASMASR